MKQLTKKWLMLLLAVVAAICLALGVAGCKTKTGGDEGDNGDNGDGTITLTAPVVTLTGNVLSWEAVKDATRYIVYEGEQTTGTNVSTTSYTINKTEATGSWVYTVAAYNANANPKTGPKSEPVTYTKTATGGENQGGENQGGENQGGENQGGGNEEQGLPKLNAPMADLQGNGLNWTPDENATAYEIYKNGEKLTTIEKFMVEALGERVLPSTYTIEEATAGDKFQVLAVGDDEEYANSELSEEVEYVAAAEGTYYITSKMDELALGEDLVAGKMYKVIFASNNSLARSTGLTGVGKIEVCGNTMWNDPYQGEATWNEDTGDYEAIIVISGAGKLIFRIATQLEQVTMGFTVSLADPYEDVQDGIINTYTLKATGSVDVVIPYGIDDYFIKIELDEDVPETGNILYLVLKDSSVETQIRFGAGTTTTKPLTKDVAGKKSYYYSTSFDKSATYLYLNCGLIDLEATVSLEAPDFIYDDLPSISADWALKGVTVKGTASASAAPNPTVFNATSISEGTYTLVIKAAEGTDFRYSVDGKAYAKVPAVGNNLPIFSTDVTFGSGTKLFYLYAAGERDGVTINVLGLFDEDTFEYELTEGKDTTEAFIGGSKEKATVFTLKDVEAGKYNLNVTSAYGLTMYAVVGTKDYELDYSFGNASKEITIGEEQSISVYCSAKIFISDVTLTKIIEEPNPQLGHSSANAATVVLYGDVNYKASVTFDLVDVTPGTYTVGLVFKDVNDGYRKVTVTVGGNTVSMCDPSSGYNGEQSIAINDTTLVLYAEGIGNPAGVKVTIYLLAEGEEYNPGGGTGGSETSATINFNLNWGFGDQEVDVSSLQYGIYTITLEDTDGESLGSMVYVTTTVENELLLNSDNGYSASITINSESIKLNGMGQSGTITVKLVRTGDIPQTGGSETSATIRHNFNWMGGDQEIDVSSLQFGTYTITVEDTDGESLGNMLFVTTSVENELMLSSGNNYTATITIDSGTIKINGMGQSGEVVIKLVKAG